MKGTITIESSSAGTECTILIPVHFVPNRSVITKCKHSKIWILESNAFLRESLVQYCELRGIEIQAYQHDIPYYPDQTMYNNICLIANCSMITKQNNGFLNLFTKVILFGFVDEVRLCKQFKQSIFLTKPIKYTSLIDALNKSILSSPSTSSNIEPNSTCSVLLVEDNIVNQKVIVTMLSRLNHSYCIANDIKEAMELCAICNPKVIILDLHLPDGNGYDMAERLRKQGCKCKIIASSSITDDEFEQEPKHVHFDAFLCKPVSFQSLQFLLTM